MCKRYKILIPPRIRRNHVHVVVYSGFSDRLLYGKSVTHSYRYAFHLDTSVMPNHNVPRVIATCLLRSMQCYSIIPVSGFAFALDGHLPVIDPIMLGIIIDPIMLCMIMMFASHFSP